MNARDKKASRRMRFTGHHLATGIAALCYTALVALLVGTYSPQDVFRAPPPGLQNVIARFLPQGWSFFTKDPRESTYIVMRDGSRAPEAINDITKLTSRDLSGLSRQRRNDMVQYEILTRTITETGCPANTHSCPAQENNGRVQVLNPLLNPRLCGPFDAVAYEHIPWHWLEFSAERFRKTHIVEVTLDCH